MTRQPLLAAIAYGLVAKLSQELLLVDGLAPVWAASGIAVLVAWRWGVRGLVPLLVVDFANSVSAPADLEPLVALGTASATGAEALLGAWILRRAAVRPELDRLRDVWGLATAAALASSLGAVVGGSVLELASAGSGDLLLTWRSWAFGDGLGIVLIGGALLCWGVARHVPEQPGRTPEILIGAAVLTLVATLALVVSVQLLPLAFPLLVLTALRGRARGTLAAVGGAAAVLVVVTAAGDGPFVADDQVDGLVSMQALLASAAVTLLALAAALSERERVTTALRATARARDRAQGELRRLALRDPLTGLANRDLLNDRVAQALARARRTGVPCGVAFVDIDRFKALNDAFGHARGDELLRALAPRIARAVRPSDTVARFGGDEFVIVCDGIDGEPELRRVAERVLEAIAAPVQVGGGEITVTGTAGLALSGPGAATPDELLGDADGAMYAAKRNGASSIALRSAGSRAELVRHHELERALRGAAGRGELVLDFQPVLATDGRTVLAAEALVRWQHPERGLLAPGHFIGIAESTGLIAEIGDWVLATACAEAVLWGPDGPRVSVNLSARQLADPGLAAAVSETLRATGLDAHRLELELTETAVLDAAAAAGVLDGLAALGVRLALDDVGTGWSSLARVRELPLSTLKIDRAFVQDLGDGARAGSAAAEAVVRAIAGIGTALGLDTVAEGVETDEQALAAVAAGATALQGFLFSRPISALALRALLAAPEAGTTPQTRPG